VCTVGAQKLALSVPFYQGAHQQTTGIVTEGKEGKKGRE
jgi:hypothetical protein